jgi:lysophospholipase L1-like esterase
VGGLAGLLGGRHRDHAAVVRHRWVVGGTAAVTSVTLGLVALSAWSDRGHLPASQAAAGLGPVESPAAPVASAATSSPTPSPLVAPGSNVLVIGDSLALDLDPGLAAALPDRSVRVVAQVGRSTESILGALRNYARLAPLPPVLVVSAGTNDGAQAMDRFRSQVADVLTVAGPRRCVLWTTVYRRADVRSDDQAFNAVLAQAAQRSATLRLVDWVGVVNAHPDWLISDGVHPDTRGLQARVELVTAAVRACSPALPGAHPARFPALAGDPWAGLGPAPGILTPRLGGSAARTASSSASASGSPTPSDSASPTAAGGSSTSAQPTPSSTDSPSAGPTTAPTTTGSAATPTSTAASAASS